MAETAVIIAIISMCGTVLMGLTSIFKKIHKSECSNCFKCESVETITPVRTIEQIIDEAVINRHDEKVVIKDDFVKDNKDDTIKLDGLNITIYKGENNNL